MHVLVRIPVIIVSSRMKFDRLGDPLDEIVLFSVHIFYVIMWHHDVIRELGNRCHAGLLYYFLLSKCNAVIAIIFSDNKTDEVCVGPEVLENDKGAEYFQSTF